MNRKTDAELSKIYRDAFYDHPLRETDPALALASAGEELQRHLAPGRTGTVDQEALTWRTDETPVRYEDLGPAERAAVDAVSWKDETLKGGIGRPGLARQIDGALVAYFQGEEDEVGHVLSAPDERENLRSAGWNVWTGPTGARLTCSDKFSGEREDFGVHDSAARAWEVARLIAGWNKPSAIVGTGKP